jgi:hypothetical protein
MTAYLGTTDALLRIESLQNANWYKNQLLMDVINTIRSINFAVQAERGQALNTLGSLPGDAPYAIALDNNQNSTTNIRFTLGIAYICEAVQPWNNFFQTLISALSFKERTTEKTMLGNMQAPNAAQNSATPSSTMILSNYNDASQAFANTITNMLDAVTTTNGIYNQSRFEQEFNVEWGTPAFQNSRGRFGKAVDTTIFFGNAKPSRVPRRVVDLAVVSADGMPTSDDEDEFPLCPPSRAFPFQLDQKLLNDEWIAFIQSRSAPPASAEVAPKEKST